MPCLDSRSSMKLLSRTKPPDKTRFPPRPEPSKANAEAFYHTGEAPCQPFEIYDQNVGAKLGIAEKSLAAGPLSGKIYTICTLLSTDIVENRIDVERKASRKALLDAGFRAVPPGHWRSGE